MPALLELQRSFAAALRDEADGGVWPAIVEDGIVAAERLRIYRNTCRSTLVETLRIAYPAVERLVGTEFFAAAARRYAEANAARSGYLNDYGGGFAAFLERFGPARSLAYLADVARFEWALSVAANAVDAPVLLPGALAGMEGEVRFVPHPSLSVLVLAFPADEIADAVMAGDETAMGEVHLGSGPVRLVVHRGPGGLETERLDAPAHAFLSRLFAGEALGEIIEAAGDDAPALLARQLAKGRLSGYRSVA